jgi:hypothetical protein
MAITREEAQRVLNADPQMLIAILDAVKKGVDANRNNIIESDEMAKIMAGYYLDNPRPGVQHISDSIVAACNDAMNNSPRGGAAYLRNLHAGYSDVALYFNKSDLRTRLIDSARQIDPNSNVVVPTEVQLPTFEVLCRTAASRPR